MESNREIEPKEIQIPRAPEEFTPEVLTALLRQAGVLREGAVERVEVTAVPAGSGFMGQAAHLKLTYDREEGDAPAQIFAKLSSADENLRARLNAMGLYETEAGFYSELGGEFPVRVPRAYASHYDAEAGGCLLLLEHIGHLRFGDNLAGSTLPDARAVIASLARMQAHFWNSDRLKRCGWLRDSARDSASTIPMYQALMPAFEQRWAATASAETILAARTFAQCMPAWLNNIAAGPFTLTHGDFRPDNFAFDGNGDLVLFDWQSARRCNNTRDLAYFMAISLPVELRRAHEEDLLRLYHDTLLGAGVTGYSMAQLRADYRRSLGSALIAGVFAGTMLDLSSERALQLVTAIFKRVGAALEDHEFAAWLPGYLETAPMEA